MTSVLPFAGSGPNGMVEVEGREEMGMGFYRVASAGYFRTMDIPLIQGRLFDERDDASVQDVVLVNETLAGRLWPGEDPLGKRMSVPGMDAYQDPSRGVHPRGFTYNRLATVIGVVGDVRHSSLTGDPYPEYYFHYKQRPGRARSATVVIRTDQEPTALVAPVRSQVRTVDGDVPAAYATMEQRIGGSVADRRFTMALLSAFAILALVLSAVGIYGVVSYSVARRTREIGIRMALGAEPGGVRAIVLREAMGMVVVGLALGLVGSFALARLLQNMLFEVSATDGLTYVVVAMLLGGVAFAATWLPARRTTRIDPMVTMQAE
jgi:putative ABC transport system permease protein